MYKFYFSQKINFRNLFLESITHVLSHQDVDDCSRYLDTSLIDVDVQPTYLRVTVKGKVIYMIYIFIIARIL